jgi:hypothetical protein
VPVSEEGSASTKPRWQCPEAPQVFNTSTHAHPERASPASPHTMCADTLVKTSARPLSSSLAAHAGMRFHRPWVHRAWPSSGATQSPAALADSVRHTRQCKPPSLQARRALSTRREEESARDHASAHCRRPRLRGGLPLLRGRRAAGGGRMWRQRVPHRVRVKELGQDLRRAHVPLDCSSFFLGKRKLSRSLSDFFSCQVKPVQRSFLNWSGTAWSVCDVSSGEEGECRTRRRGQLAACD